MPEVAIAARDGIPKVWWYATCKSGISGLRKSNTEAKLAESSGSVWFVRRAEMMPGAVVVLFSLDSAFSPSLSGFIGTAAIALAIEYDW